jgi:hypothetical protein
MTKILPTSVLFALGCVACPATEDTGHDCEAGTHWDGSACVPDEADADTDSDADGDTDTDSDTDSDVDDTGPTDDDGDGWTIAGGDCDDGDRDVNPGEDEVCGDGVDNDCNGSDARCGLAGRIPLSEADAKLTGEDVSGGAGRRLVVQDINGDGIVDVLISADQADTAYLVLGPVSGDADLASADATFVAEGEHNDAGRALAAGDIDDDGVEDVLIGAWMDSTGGTQAGAAYLVLGPVSGDIDLSTADATFIGQEARNWAGSTVAVGDLNADGTDDVLIGAAGWEPEGAVYLLFEPVMEITDLSAADAMIVGEEIYMENGISVVKDLDGDGVDDLLIPGNYWDGVYNLNAVYIVHGPVTETVTLSEAADAMFIGADNYDYAGTSIATGDLNGDGLEDILIGAPGMGIYEPGGAYLEFGPVDGIVGLSEADATLQGGEDYEYAGMSVAVGDLDNDSVEDSIVGSDPNGEGSTPGRAYLTFGPIVGIVDLSETDATLEGEFTQDEAGYQVAAGDLNADGVDDVLVSAPGNDEGGYYAGAAYLVFGIEDGL